MKRIHKGEPGYLKSQRTLEIIKAVVAFALVLAVFLAGYLHTHTKANLMTVVAILGCLPASKVMVGVITRFPYQSIDAEKANEIRSKTENLMVIYDMIITSREKIMPVDCIVIFGHTVCGYTCSEKMDLNYINGYIKEMLGQNQIQKVSVKIFHDYVKFFTRAEGMNSMAAIDQPEEREIEERIRQLILSISM
ncbi:MAG: hypothetical protein PHN80_11000 [Hespellia sp.]|nr:hypothetical protein [Hespellia sp.]